MLLLSKSALRGPGIASSALAAFALLASPALAQSPPPDGTGGAAGVMLPPPGEMRSAPQPMNAPSAPADSIEESSEAATSETPKEDAEPTEDGSSTEQPR